MSRTYEAYREELESQEDWERQQRFEEERQYYIDKMRMEEEFEKEFERELQELSETPTTENDLFRQILEDEKNEDI